MAKISDTARLKIIKLRDELRDARIERGISQREIAKRMGTTPSCISRFEKSKFPNNKNINIRVSSIINYAIAIDYDIEFILSRQRYTTKEK